MLEINCLSIVSAAGHTTEGHSFFSPKSFIILFTETTNKTLSFPTRAEKLYNEVSVNVSIK